MAALPATMVLESFESGPGGTAWDGKLAGKWNAELKVGRLYGWRADDGDG